MAGLIVLDTTVLIDHLRGSEAARSFLQALRTVPACSELTRIELMRGMRSGERRATDRLMAMIRWIPVDTDVARLAGELGRRYRRSHLGLSVSDLVVAATAQRLEAKLATSNVRHFPMFRNLQPPY